MKTEQRSLKTGEQLNFEVALKSTRIAYADINQVKETLRFVMMKIGVRGANLPGEIEKLVLIQHIQTNYGGHALDEIKLAFEMAITGKLDVDATCYENFSCLYFSNIMNAYRQWAREEIKTPAQETRVDPIDINIEYAIYLRNQINKLPFKV